MRARDGVEEDLSAYAREDLVYKAKLAEQAERCARHRIARANGDGRRAGRRGRVSRRRRRATRERDRDATETRARERESDRARDRAHARVESSRFGSIRFDRSIDRTNDRPTEWAPDRTNERSVCDARAGGGRGRGWRRAMKGGSTRPRRPRADRGRGERTRGGANASESKGCEARGD